MCHNNLVCNHTDLDLILQPFQKINSVWLWNQWELSNKNCIFDIELYIETNMSCASALSLKLIDHVTIMT